MAYKITRITVGSDSHVHKTIIIPLITYDSNPLIYSTLINILEDLEVNINEEHNSVLKEIAATLNKSPRAQFSIFGSRHNSKHPVHALYFVPVYINKSRLIIDNINNLGRYLDVFRDDGGNCATTINHNGIGDFSLKLDKDHLAEGFAFLEGLLLSMYRFTKYKTETADDDKFTTTHINLLLAKSASSKSLVAKLEDRANTIMIQTRSVYMARDMINEPANHRSVTDFISTVQNISKQHDVNVYSKVLDSVQLSKIGMNLLVSVGAASQPKNRSRLLMLSNRPFTSKTGSPDLVLIGKGVMFDTGGLNLKANDDDLYQEKTDMAGAAIIASFLLGYTKLCTSDSRHIIAMLPLAQNDVGPKGTHPGDILRAYNGTTVEIMDTDAEGRLLLADCLAYASKNYKGATVIDMATLTGDQAYMSCKTFSSVISRHPDLVATLVDCGNIIQERIVESPYEPDFLDYLESPIADIRNIGDSKCRSDTIVAGVFLGEFVDSKIEWAHLDIAGTSYGMDEKKSYYPAEGSAVGVRLLFEFVKSLNARNRLKTRKIKQLLRVSNSKKLISEGILGGKLMDWTVAQ